MANRFPIELFLQATQQKQENERKRTNIADVFNAAALGGQGIVDQQRANKQQDFKNTLEKFKFLSDALQSQGLRIARKDGQPLNVGDFTRASDKFMTGEGIGNDPEFTLENIPKTTVMPFALNTDLPVPEGMEVVGYDQKGNKMLRKKVDPAAALQAKMTETKALATARAEGTNSVTPKPSADAMNKEKLARGGLDSLADVKRQLDDKSFGALKTALIDPTGIARQGLSGASKDIYAKVRNAIGNILYIKTGAAATPKEIDEQMAKYAPSIVQSKDDWSKTVLDLLERDLTYYSPDYKTQATAPALDDDPMRLFK